MSLIWGLTRLVKEPGKCTIDTDLIAGIYKQWILSDPFDIGLTTKEALGPL